jgi:hypothetical protein
MPSEDAAKSPAADDGEFCIAEPDGSQILDPLSRPVHPEHVILKFND